MTVSFLNSGPCRSLASWAVPLCAGLVGLSAAAQVSLTSGPVDPAIHAHLRRPRPSHETAQFIWTANDAAAHNPDLQARVRGQNDKTEPHYFRASFDVRAVPPAATLYLAGPRAATVYLNGREVLRAMDDGTRPKNLSVLRADVSQALRPGRNVLAIEEVRGHSSLHTGASPTINQVTYGEVLAVKLVPAQPGIDAPPLLVSDPHWRSTLHLGASDAGDWKNPRADDSAWEPVESLGVLGSRRDFLQWNADAGLYAWPGYSGISGTLRVFDLKPASAVPVAGGMLLDFGREISGRLRLTSSAATAATVTASFGESREEALRDKGYLGTRQILVPPHATAYGPKSGFRYVKLSSTSGLQASAQAITYPVQYQGSFHSSDPLLDRIWQTSAYTARLCMQEGVWDGVKRDRGRWMGDLDVTGRTITAVFGEHDLMARTMAEIIGEAPVTRDINTITGYSALWVTGQANFYRHTGDLAYLQTLQPQLLDLLRLMEGELDPTTKLFTNPDHHKVFVDWSEGFTADTPEARAATHFAFVAAFSEAAYLLTELRNTAAAEHYRTLAAAMRETARDHLMAADRSTFGARWQTNAMAVLADAPDDSGRQAIWRGVLSHVGEPGAVITPYQGYYALSAMARLDHRREALDWMRTYWGGMLAEGATSFWESYDPHWPKQDFHAHLEADNKRGYYVSLAHGWASGPAAFLIEEILGIHPTASGFREVVIRPDLAGLAFAKGAEPTPRGLIAVSATPHRVEISLPPETRALLLLPFTPSRLNGKAMAAPPTAEGRARIELTHAGHYVFSSPPRGREACCLTGRSRLE